MLPLEFERAYLSANRENAVTLWFAAAMQIDQASNCSTNLRAEVLADVRGCPPKFSCFRGNPGHLFPVCEKMVGAARIELATPPV